MKGGNAAVNESLLIPKNGTLLELCPGSNEGFIGGGAGGYTRTYREGSRAGWDGTCTRKLSNMHGVQTKSPALASGTRFQAKS